MMNWIDFHLFGNGHGMAPPYWDGTFYWLAGDLYYWSSGCGAQLYSFGWRTPLPGTERRLFGHTFRVFSVSRCGPRVMIAWGHAPAVRNFAEVARLKQDMLDHLAERATTPAGAEERGDV